MSGIILRVLAVSEHQIHTNPGLDSELSDLMTETPSQIWTVEDSTTVNNQVLAVAMTQGSMAMVSLGVWSYGTTVLCVVGTEWNFISCMTILVRHIANEAQRPWSCAHGKLELALMLAFIQGSVCLFEPAAWTLLEIYPTSIWQIFWDVQNMAASAGHLCLPRDSLHCSKQELQARFKVPWIFLQWKF